tara:strand:- start:395 stop:1321 length:927 start_codon:yes stop_codon:yes gene_type:complete
MSATNYSREYKFNYSQFFNGVVKVLLFFSILLLAKNIYSILTTTGWSDRAAFFLKGDLAPSLPDFIFSEIVLPFFLVYILIVGVRPIFFIIFFAASLAYFNRSPIVLLAFALMFSPNISAKSKLFFGGIFVLLTILIMYLRVGDAIFEFETFAFFFFTYPFVGISRLMETGLGPDVNGFHMIGILLKPIDSIFFVSDYIFSLNGDLSAGKFSALELNQFRYLPFLEGSFNAFGTLVFPFVYIFGWFFGLSFFGFFIIFYYYAYRYHFRQHSAALRIILMLLTTGLLFSWNSPFIWIMPFFFPRSQYYR